jgi:hypothetical protein
MSHIFNIIDSVPSYFCFEHSQLQNEPISCSCSLKLIFKLECYNINIYSDYCPDKLFSIQKSLSYDDFCDVNHDVIIYNDNLYFETNIFKEIFSYIYEHLYETLQQVWYKYLLFESKNKAYELIDPTSDLCKHWEKYFIIFTGHSDCGLLKLWKIIPEMSEHFILLLEPSTQYFYEWQKYCIRFDNNTMSKKELGKMLLHALQIDTRKNPYLLEDTSSNLYKLWNIYYTEYQ